MSHFILLQKINIHACRRWLRYMYGFCIMAAAVVCPAEALRGFEESATDGALQFIGLIERDNLYHVTANSRGTVADLELEFGQPIKRGESLLTIRPLDPGFARSVIAAPFEGGTLVEKYVDNGHFVEVNDLLLKVAKDEAYKVVIKVPAYEVRYFKTAIAIELALYSPRGRDVRLDYTAMKIQPPASRGSLYQVELEIDCRRFSCASHDLAGSLVKMEMYGVKY